MWDSAPGRDRGWVVAKLAADQGGRLTLQKGDDPKDLRRALKAATGSRVHAQRSMSSIGMMVAAMGSQNAPEVFSELRPPNGLLIHRDLVSQDQVFQAE